MFEKIKEFFRRGNPYAELAVALEPYGNFEEVECCRRFFASGNLPPKAMLMLATLALISATKCPSGVTRKMLELCKEA